MFRAYALPQSCNHFIIQILRVVSLYFKIINRVRCIRNSWVSPPLFAHVGRASNFILPLERARRQNDTFGTVIIMMLGSVRPQHHHIIMWQKCNHYVKTAQSTLIDKNTYDTHKMIYAKKEYDYDLQ